MDTKFTSIFTRSQWRETSLRSGYLYQLYAYVRSQARTSDPLSHGTEGILLHPAINLDVDEAVVIQGHVLRFLTVDLAGTNATISDQLRQSIIPRFPGQKTAASLQS
jgi:5-methylcytosine-specific restriction enzyme subunit McrC